MTDLRITHIGGPTTLVEFEGWRIVTDPTFDPPGRRYRFGWGTASTKVTGPALTVDEVGPVDAVLLTHDHHADNLDDAGRAMLPAAGVVVTTRSGAQRLGGNTIGLEPWETTRLAASGRPDVEVIATPCRHGPRGSRRIVGDVVGFALRWARQRHGVVWISGDTVLFDGVRDVAELLDVGTALIHLGGVRFGLTGPVRYTMTAHDAVELCQLVRPATAIPVHYEGWSHFRQGRSECERVFAAAPASVRDRILWLPRGEAVDVDA
jgi:L-ascorbate metabolism protein UlaG (beta-lactamase superfamily)